MIMFFEEDNCITLRLLHEASDFLEASLEKLLALEQEAINELKGGVKNNTKRSDQTISDRIIHESCDFQPEINLNSNNEEVCDGNLNCMPIESVSREVENICECGSHTCDHGSHFSSKKIKLSSLKSLQIPCNVEEPPPDAKHKVIHLTQVLSANSNNVMDEKLEIEVNDMQNVKMENFSSDISDVNADIYSDRLIVHSNTAIQSCCTESVTLSKGVTLLEEYFKVCIKFKESLPYETVEELIKSVGLGDVFDIVLTKRKAEVTFLNENDMKRALDLPPAALSKLKASVIFPLKKKRFRIK